MTSKVLTVAALCLLSLVACADSEEQPEATGSTGADENRVEIAMTEFAYGMPEEITGGTTTLEFTNNGEIPHEAAFGSIAGDHDLDDVMKAIRSGKEPDWFADLAGIPVLDAGSTASMTRDLEPGRYIFMCFLPDPKTGAPHVTEGMVHLFEAAGTSDAEPPEADLTITATDDGFEVPDVAAGEQTIELVNDGSKAHEFAIFSLDEDKSEEDIEEWFRTAFESEKPGLFPGGLQSIEPGTSVVVELTFESGRTYIVEDFEGGIQTEFEVE